MKHLSDEEIYKELEKLDHPFQLTSVQKEKMKHRVFIAQQHKKSRQTRGLLPAIISLIVIFSIVVGVFTLLSNDTEFGIGNSPINSITDSLTPETLPIVPQTENTFLIEWGSDSMYRGDYDFSTSIHGKLVVTPDFDELKRGQVVYYHMPPHIIQSNPRIPRLYIGRVVGLPGETIEIKDGQVYIDNQFLDTFYGKATMHGLGEDEYFKAVSPIVIVDEQRTRDYFNMNMAAVTVEENTVFILVDQWWRGTDSLDYGPLPIEKIEGVVIGYEE